MSEAQKAKLMELVWQHSLGGMAIIGADDKFQKANPTYCKILEYSEYELQNLRYEDITVPTDAAVYRKLSEEVRNGTRESYDLIKSCITKTKRIVFIHLRVHPIKKPDGTFELFLSQVYEVPATVLNGVTPQAVIKSESKPTPNPFGLFGKYWKEITTVGVLVLAGLGMIAKAFSDIPG